MYYLCSDEAKRTTTEAQPHHRGIAGKGTQPTLVGKETEHFSQRDEQPMHAEIPEFGAAIRDCRDSWGFGH